MSKPSRSKHAVWPIAALAFALCAFGFYFAFFQPVESLSADPAPTFVWNGLEKIPTSTGTYSYRYTAKQNAWNVAVEQVIEGKQGKRRATNDWNFTVVETQIEPNIWERRYRNVTFNFLSDEKPVGSHIQFDVSRLIESAVHHIERTENGAVKSVTLVSGKSARLARAFATIDQLLSISSPSWPAETISTTESWKRRFAQNDKSGIEQQLTFAATDKRNAWVEITTQQKNDFDNANVKGTGTGVAVFDVADGHLTRATLSFENVVTIAHPDPAAKTSMRIVINEIPYVK